MTDDLVTWLQAQLDEDERVARAAWGGDGWRHENMPDEVWTGRSAPGHTPIPIAKAWDSATAEYIARHDPARVLREVEAKRLLLALGLAMMTPLPATAIPVSAAPYEAIAHEYDARRASDILHLLALPYADRVGYREGWRP